MLILPALAALCWPDQAQAFRNFELGAQLPNATRPTLDGKKASLLSKVHDLSVFVFFRPDQEFSRGTLEEIADCQQRFADRSIHWVGVVSDYYPVQDSKLALSEAGLRMPVLIDKGDEIYGRMGVKLHPVVGIADRAFKLRAYEPFRKINYCIVIEARIRHALGEIDDQALARALDPPRAKEGGDPAKARRNFKFAEMLFKAKKLDKAVGLVDKALALDPELAAAHALKGEIQAEQGDCKAALIEFEKALAIDAEEARARQGKARCGGSAAVPSPTGNPLASR